MTEIPVSHPDQAPPSEEEHGGIIYSAGIIPFSEDLSRVLVVIHAKGTTVGAGVTGLPGGRNEKDPETGELESNDETAVKETGQETGRLFSVGSLIIIHGNVFRASFPDLNEEGVMRLHEWDISRAFVGDLGDFEYESPEGLAKIVEVEELYNGYKGAIAPNVLNAIANALDQLESERYD